MLKGDACTCTEESEGVVVSSGGDSAGVKDAFCGKVPELNIVHILHLVHGKLGGEERQFVGDIGFLIKIRENDLLFNGKNWVKVQLDLGWG